MASKQLVTDILSGEAPSVTDGFRLMPLADKLIELEKAVVEPKRSDTPTLLHKLVKALVSQGAIYPDEASAVYSRLLERVVKFNSLRNHNNLQALVNDVQQGQKSAVLSNLRYSGAYSNMVVLQNFFNSLPTTVTYGQQNYDAFKQLLKQFIIDYSRFVEVFKSGPDTILQYNYGPGVHKVNLSQAFANLHDMWGAKVTTENSIPSLIALLQPQTRFLLLLLSPIAMEGYFIRDSFISYILKLYKNTVNTPYGGQPVAELGDVIASLGPSYDQLKLRQSLNYLINNNQTEYRPEVPEFTKEEIALLRYIQTLLKTKVAGRNRLLNEADLDNVIRNLNLAAFPGQLDFINKVFDYFRKLVSRNPRLLTQIVYNRDWKPPASFFLKNVLLPQDLEPLPTPTPTESESNVLPPVQENRQVFPDPRFPRRRKRRGGDGQAGYREPERYTTASDSEDSSSLPLFVAPPRSDNAEILRESMGNYREVPKPYTTEESSDSSLETENSEVEGQAVVNRDGSVSFTKMKGRGINNLLLLDVLRRVRYRNVRPY